MNKLLIGFVIVVLLGGGAWFILKNPGSNTAPSTNDTAVSIPEANSETALSDIVSPPPDLDASGNETESKKDNGTAITESQQKSFAVAASNFKFSVPEMRVKKGDQVSVTLKNTEGMHDWVLEEYEVRTQQLTEGKSETVEFTADTAGTFEYYCSVGQHRKLGMVGKLIVE